MAQRFLDFMRGPGGERVLGQQGLVLTVSGERSLVIGEGDPPPYPERGVGHEGGNHAVVQGSD